jgi:uncharacterized repeat protein (TIGR03803 family)
MLTLNEAFLSVFLVHVSQEKKVMSNVKSSRGRGSALLVALILILVVVPGAWAASKYKTLTKFTHTKDGKSPLASLIFDQAGNLYGTTFVGGWPAKNDGTVFKLTPSQDGSWTESVLYRFCSRRDCRDGARPYAGLIFDQAGNLYGTTAFGGDIDDHGVVFKLTPNPDGTWTERVLHRFCSLRNCADGYTPYGGLIFDQTGNLYGTTGGGGAHNGGTVFKLAENHDGSWSQSVLFSFCSLTNCADGGGPEASLIFDQVGNLYGTTNGGGPRNGGTVFKLTPNQDGSWTEKVLHDFCTFPCHDDGQSPHAAVILDGAGNLYGTTFEGGAHEAGVVFQLTPNADGSPAMV